MFRLESESQPCGYLPAHRARMDGWLAQPDDESFCRLIEAGYRHFGAYYFRPDCPGTGGGCRQCIPIRIPTATFQPSKTQRRALRRAQGMRVVVDSRPAYLPEKYALYLRHKKHMRPPIADEPMDEENFVACFYRPHPFTHELRYEWEGKTIGLGWLDIASRAASSIYFCHDPDAAHLSPGIVSVLHEIQWARSLGIPHYYLGYWIEANASMNYKRSFRPAEILDGENWLPLGEKAPKPKPWVSIA